MKIDRLKTMRGAGAAIVLAFGGFALAWMCIQVAALQVLPPTAPLVLAVDPDNPDLVLGAAIAKLEQNESRFDRATLASVQRIAGEYPLDARPYLILGRIETAQGDTKRATALLEAGQLRDPRNRLINAFLLERYVQAEEIDLAAQQLGVLARLVSRVDLPITQALAQMAANPRTLPAVRQALAKDTALERNVLVTLASGDTRPEQIFDLASPTAMAGAGAPDGFGPPLIARLIANGQYEKARTIWKRIYRISASAAAAPIYNPQFQDMAGAPPFDWTFAGSGLGAADPGADGLRVDYYGRETGDLAGQLLVLRPGRYRLSFATEEGQAAAESRLSWQVLCADNPAKPLVSIPVDGSKEPRSAEFAVPPGCLAQTLRLYGESGEFPEAVDTTISKIAISPVSGSAR